MHHLIQNKKCKTPLAEEAAAGTAIRTVAQSLLFIACCGPILSSRKHKKTRTPGPSTVARIKLGFDMAANFACVFTQISLEVLAESCLNRIVFDDVNMYMETPELPVTVSPDADEAFANRVRAIYDRYGSLGLFFEQLHEKKNAERSVRGDAKQMPNTLLTSFATNHRGRAKD